MKQFVRLVSLAFYYRAKNGYNKDSAELGSRKERAEYMSRLRHRSLL